MTDRMNIKIEISKATLREALGNNPTREQLGEETRERVYQYQFYQQEVDYFSDVTDASEEQFAPNCFTLSATRDVSRTEFRDYCRALRDGERLTEAQKRLKASIVRMGAAW